MIVDTSKGAVSLADATAVTIKRNPAAYVPKVIGALAALIGLLIIGSMVQSLLHDSGGSRPRWWEWLMIAFFVLTIFSTLIGGGLSMFGSSGKAGEEDGHVSVAVTMCVLAACVTLVALAIPSAPAFLLCATLFGLGGSAWWSRKFAGTVDATVAYPTHSTSIRAISPDEAQRLTAAFRQLQPAAQGGAVIGSLGRNRRAPY